MIYTTHAKQRMRQRAVAPLDVELIVRFGKKLWRRGSKVSLCNLKCVQKMVQMGVSPQVAESLRGCYVVYSDETVVTVAHCTKRMVLH